MGNMNEDAKNEQKRDKRISFRATEDLKNWIEQQASTAGRTASDYAHLLMEKLKAGQDGADPVDLAGLREEWQLRVDQKTREVEAAKAEAAALRAELAATKKTVEVLEKSLDDTRAALADTRGEKDRAWGMVAEAAKGEPNLAARERELLAVFPRLPVEDQRHILDTARDLAAHRQKTRSTPHKSADDPPRKDKSDRPRA